ncbi:MAG: regulatory protein GemA [Betaproteobacteria bacterium]|nr:regulatory protein GemA [Betaproteobacteria bacterium]MCL2886517.1 regulatory protein GemA [Betaproteobacteria bacterium]
MNRAQAIKLIHVARRDLQIDDAAWKALLAEKFRVASSKDLDITGLYKLVEHLKKCGFKVRHKAECRRGEKFFAPTKPAPVSRPLAGAAQADPGEAAKIRALWLFLHQPLGLVRDPSEKALAAYIKRMTGVDDLHWLNGRQCRRVIEGLKKWAERIFPAKLAERLDALEAVGANNYSPLHDALERGAYDACLTAWEALDESAPANEGSDS